MKDMDSQTKLRSLQKWIPFGLSPIEVSFWIGLPLTNSLKLFSD